MTHARYRRGGLASIGDAIDEWRRVTDLRPLAQRLADRYGLGTRPAVASAWYRRVEATCTGDTPQADAAWEILQRCVERAADADKPQHYLCDAVSRAYRDAGIWPARGATPRMGVPHDRAAAG